MNSRLCILISIVLLLGCIAPALAVCTPPNYQVDNVYITTPSTADPRPHGIATTDGNIYSIEARGNGIFIYALGAQGVGTSTFGANVTSVCIPSSNGNYALAASNDTFVKLFTYNNVTNQWFLDWFYNTEQAGTTSAFSNDGNYFFVGEQNTSIAFWKAPAFVPAPAPVYDIYLTLHVMKNNQLYTFANITLFDGGPLGIAYKQRGTRGYTDSQGTYSFGATSGNYMKVEVVAPDGSIEYTLLLQSSRTVYDYTINIVSPIETGTPYYHAEFNQSNYIFMNYTDPFDETSVGEFLVYDMISGTLLNTSNWTGYYGSYSMPADANKTYSVVVHYTRQGNVYDPLINNIFWIHSGRIPVDDYIPAQWRVLIGAFIVFLTAFLAQRNNRDFIPVFIVCEMFLFTVTEFLIFPFWFLAFLFAMSFVYFIGYRVYHQGG